jgi:hypothetical protein
MCFGVKQLIELRANCKSQGYSALEFMQHELAWK